jgi:iron complex outermembrane receptor protein
MASLVLAALLLLPASPSDPGPRPATEDEAGQGGETVVVAPPPSPFEGVREEGHLDRPSGAPATVAERLSEAAALERNARGEQSVLLHGFEQRQLMVHFDGVPLRLPYDGRLDLGKLPQGLVERLVLVKGPSPMALGPTGMGGAVALHGPDPREAGRLGLGLMASSHALTASARAGFSTGRGGLVVAGDLLSDQGAPLPRREPAGRYEDGGRRENADRQGGALGLLGRIDLAKGHRVDVLGLAWLGAFGVPPGVDSAAPRFWRFPEYDVGLLRLAHSGKYRGGLEVREHLSATLYRNVLVGYDDESYSSRVSGRAFRSVYEDVSGQAGLHIALPLRGRGPLRGVRLQGRLGLGVDGHREREDGGERLSVSELISETALEATLRFERGHFLVLGLEGQVSAPGSLPRGAEAPRAAWHAGPLVGYGWMGRKTGLAITLARKARFPTLRERYADAFGGQEPNPGLRPESAWHGWASLEWRPMAWLRLAALPFAAHLSDRIERQALGGGLTQQQNAGTAALLGVELTASAKSRLGLEGRISYQWLHSWRSDPPLGEPGELLGRAPHQAVAQGSWALPGRMRIGTSMRVRAAQHGQDPDTGLVSSMPACLRWDARAEWGPYRGLRLLLAAQNLLDGRCASAPGYPEPGRLLWAGISFAQP